MKPNFYDKKAEEKSNMGRGKNATHAKCFGELGQAGLRGSSRLVMLSGVDEMGCERRELDEHFSLSLESETSQVEFKNKA